MMDFTVLDTYVCINSFSAGTTRISQKFNKTILNLS